MDTATENRSVAVARGARLLALRVSELRASSSLDILSEIDEALRAASVGVRDVDLFASTNGPGSFTGLRSGLATIKALATTLEKPVVGVPTLHALAYGAGPAEQIVSLIPAGRGEVFAQFLGVTSDGAIVEHDAPAHVSPPLLFEKALKLQGGLRWAMTDSDAFVARIIEGAEQSGTAFVDAPSSGGESLTHEWVLARPVRSLAENVGALALNSFRRGLTVEAKRLRAVYVRASDAELKEQCR